MSKTWLRWTDKDVAYLRKNYGKVSQKTLVANLQNRKLERIINQARKLGIHHCSRKYLWWTDQEIAYLRKNYGKISNEILSAKLHNRSWDRIKSQAYKIGLIHPGFANKKADLSILLHDNPITYYWIGFLLADGGFTDRRIQLGVVKKDLAHLQRFLFYVNSKNKIQVNDNQYRVKLTNVKVVTALREKFGISNRKTYEPCPLHTLPQNDLLFALIIGFIDGDGSVSKNGKRNSYMLSVVGHSSWLNNFILMKKFLHSYFLDEKNFSEPCIRESRVKLPQNKEKTTHKLAHWYICRKSLLLQIKQNADVIGLPYLARKLGQIS